MSRSSKVRRFVVALALNGRLPTGAANPGPSTAEVRQDPIISPHGMPSRTSRSKVRRVITDFVGSDCQRAPVTGRRLEF